MRAVDASVWVSRLVQVDEHYHASRRWLAHHLSGGSLLIAPALLLIEVAGAVSRRTGSSQLAHQATSRLLDLSMLRLVSVDQVLAREAARLAADLQLRGADAAYVAVAHHLNIPLVTWDREQAEKAQGAVIVLTPETDA